MESIPKSDNVQALGKIKTRDLLLYGAIGFAAWYLFRKSHAVSTLVYIPRGIGFGNGGMQITIGVQNPTSTALTLRSIAGTVFLNGDSVGNISDFNAQVIAPNQETPVTLVLSPNVFGIAQLATEAIKNGLDSASFSVSGFANVDDNTFPVSFNFSPNINNS